jgi:hypothetical protein
MSGLLLKYRFGAIETGAASTPNSLNGRISALKCRGCMANPASMTDPAAEGADAMGAAGGAGLDSGAELGAVGVSLCGREAIQERRWFRTV